MVLCRFVCVHANFLLRLRDSRGPQSIEWGPARLTPGCSLPSLTSWGRVCGSGILFKGVLGGREALRRKPGGSSKETRRRVIFFLVLFLIHILLSSVCNCASVVVMPSTRAFLLRSCVQRQAFWSCDCAHSSFNKWKGSKSERRSTWMLTAVQAKGNMMFTGLIPRECSCGLDKLTGE